MYFNVYVYFIFLYLMLLKYVYSAAVKG